MKLLMLSDQVNHDCRDMLINKGLPHNSGAGTNLTYCGMPPKGVQLFVNARTSFSPRFPASATTKSRPAKILSSNWPTLETAANSVKAVRYNVVSC